MIAQPWTIKWGKMLLGAGSNDKVLGTRLELVALKDPFTARPGTTIPVKLLYDGKPFAGADIAYTNGLKPLPDSQQPTVKTGADGVAQIPVGKSGPVLLTTDVMTQPAHAALATADHLYASLAYNTAQ